MSSFEYKVEDSLDAQFTHGRFKNEIVVVCGGASGIGRATTERFVNDGAKVAVFDINEQHEPFDEKHSASVFFFKTDCSSKASCEKSTREAFEKLGPINHLVYSVAYFGSKALEAEEKDWMTSLSVNVAGAGYMISAVVPRMKNAQKGRKSVCLMTSISQLSAQSNRWTYGASKGALWSLVRHAALELGKDHGVRINSVSPAWVWTPEVAKAYPDKAEATEGPGKGFHILGRLVETTEVAGAITFLASRDANFIH